MGSLLHLVRRSILAARNTGYAARRTSRFRWTFTFCFCAALLIGLWALFLQGFRYLDAFGGIGLMVMNRLFGLFFFGVCILLVLSSLVTSYASLYRSDEVAFLLLRPISRGQVMLYKYLESSLLASWAFFFMIVPFLGAFAQHQELSPLFAFWAVLFSLPLVLLCTGFGMLIVLAFVRWMPRRGYTVMLLACAALVAGWGARLLFAESPSSSAEGPLFLQQIIPALKFSTHPLWPSWWVSEGMMAMARGYYSRGGLMLSMLVASLALVLMLLEAFGHAELHTSWQRVQVGARRMNMPPLGFAWIDRVTAMLPRDVGAMLAKDARTFLRDPVQWTQVLFFFGILGIYFLNLRTLHYHLMPPHWRNLIVFLNVFSVAAVMCSFGSRFVYPQLSLEGHGFWILGRSPLTMGRVLAAKFCSALIGMVTISVVLMGLSTSMLGVGPEVGWMAIGISVCISLAISGLSTGLGAVYLDTEHQNPAAILSSFGGTLNLVLGLLVICLTIVPIAVLFHAFHMGQITQGGLYGWMWVAAAWMMGIVAVATVYPLRLGHRALLARDY